MDEILARQGLAIDGESRQALLVEANSALMQQALLMIRHAEGDFRPDPHAERFPDAATALADIRPAAQALTLPNCRPGTGPTILDIWDKYKTTPPLPAPSTLKRWEPAIRSFAEFTSHKGMDAVTPGDATLFVDHRVQQSVSHRSASVVELAAVKRMFSFAHSRDWLWVNPLAGLRHERSGEKAARNREGRDFVPSEWRSILQGSMAVFSNPGNRSETMLNAMRWVPWLCAYSGARPGEIIQLRKEDFGTEDGIQAILALRQNTKRPQSKIDA